MRQKYICIHGNGHTLHYNEGEAAIDARKWKRQHPEVPIFTAVLSDVKEYIHSVEIKTKDVT